MLRTRMTSKSIGVRQSAGVQRLDDADDVFVGLALWVARWQRRLCADGIRHARVAGDGAGEFWFEAKIFVTGQRELIEDLAAFDAVLGHVDDHPRRHLRALQAQEFHHGIRVGEGCGFFRGDQDQAIGGARKAQHRWIDAGGEIKNDAVIMRREPGQAVSDAGDFFELHGAKRARAGVPRDQIEAAIASRAAHHRCHGGLQFEEAANDGMNIGGGADAELDVDIGEAEIAIDQQRSLTGAAEGDRQHGGKPRLADAALARGDRIDRRRACARQRRIVNGDVCACHASGMRRNDCGGVSASASFGESEVNYREFGCAAGDSLDLPHRLEAHLRVHFRLAHHRRRWAEAFDQRAHERADVGGGEQHRRLAQLRGLLERGAHVGDEIVQLRRRERQGALLAFADQRFGKRDAPSSARA